MRIPLRFSSILNQFVLYLNLGLILIVIPLGIFQFNSTRKAIYAQVISDGRVLINSLSLFVFNYPDTMNTEVLQPLVVRLAGNTPNISNISIINRSFFIVADSEPADIGKVAEQTTMIEVIRDRSAIEYFYTSNGRNYYRLSAPLLGEYDPRIRSNVIGAIAVDVQLALVDRQVFRQFFQSFLLVTTVSVIVVFILYLIMYRNIVSPILVLTDAARKVEAGDLTTRISVASSSEIGMLAGAFNKMTLQLHDQLNILEHQVAERTKALATSLEVSRRLSTILDQKQLIAEVVKQVQASFRYYHVQIYLYSKDSEDLILAGASNEAGRILLESGHRLHKSKGLVGRAVETNSVQLASNVLDNPNWIPNPLLPETKSEIAVPIILSGQVLGVLDVQQNIPNGLHQNDADLLISIANQMAVSFENSRLYVQLEEMVAKRTRQLEEANAELSNFAYIASHDLKAPLRAISQLSSWVKEDYSQTLDEEGQEKLSLLIDRTRHMHKLIDGILAYSRIGRVSENAVRIDLNLLVREVLEVLGPPGNIRVEIENTLPVIVGESTYITQVFQNLLGNALQYIDKPEGSIKIGCKIEGENWVFRVADNGMGIDPKYFSKIFQMFQTLGTTKNSESTGIGLALVKKIVEKWGGKVWVESTPGQGSTFFFTMPQVKE